MISAELDTLAIAKRLKTAGFSEAQAEAMTGVLHDARDADLSRLATHDDFARFEASSKADFERLEASSKADFERFEASSKAEFGRFEATIRAEFEGFGASSKAEFGRFEAAIRAEFEGFKAATASRFVTSEAATKAAIEAAVAGLRAEMEIPRRDLTIRLGGMIVVATGVLLAAKFFG